MCFRGAVNADVVFPWRTTKTPTEGATLVTPSASTVDALGDAGICFSIIENDIDAFGGPCGSTGANSTSSETWSAPERPLQGDIPSNVGRALRKPTNRIRIHGRAKEIEG